MATPTPRTPQGSGLLVPITKVMGHLMVVHEALAREWPLTSTNIAGEVRDASTHLDTIIFPREALTPEVILELNAWKDNFRDSLTAFNTGALAGSEPTEGARSEIRDLVRLTWAVLAQLEQEFTGVPIAEPGIAP